MEDNDGKGPGAENIHSGHFMVSQFEAAEDDDDDEIDPIIPTTGVMALQIYPQKTTTTTTSDVVCKFSGELSIETSLAKLFKCMKLAYRQKLTSPKWNRFKGIRLRWADKIRLNNLIWRCWHIQFIMKKKTSCQFASPLDCDIHSKPEAVVLEGKYWKRDYNVISAEYKKWRRFYHRTIDPNNALESLGDSDLDWISYGDKCLMNVDDPQWTSDLLFSTISQPFAFPDQREIARFGGIADIIQPSLGPLQPNIGEFMDTFDPLDLLGATNRLPSVPEEGPDEFLRSINFYGPELNALDVSLSWGLETTQSVGGVNLGGQGVGGAAAAAAAGTALTQPGGGGVASASVVENRIANRTEGDGRQESAAKNEATAASTMYLAGGRQGGMNVNMLPGAGGPSGRGGGGGVGEALRSSEEGHPMEMNLMEEPMGAPQVQYTAHMFAQSLSHNHPYNPVGQQQQNNLMAQQNMFGGAGGGGGGGGGKLASNMLKSLEQQHQQNVNNHNRSNANPPPQSSNLRQFIRRDPHNYDKQLPTAHQTLIYNQIVSEQQVATPQAAAAAGSSAATSSSSVDHQTGLDQQQQQQHLAGSNNSNTNSLVGMDQSYPGAQQNHDEIKMSGAGGGGGGYMFKQIDDVNVSLMHHGLGLVDTKEFGRSNSLPVNASLQMMQGGGGGMFEIEGVAERLQTTQIRVSGGGENPFVSPRNKVQQPPKQYHMGQQQQQAQLRQGGGGGMQQQQQQQFNMGQPQGTAAVHHPLLQSANSEPALIQLLQKQSGGGPIGGSIKEHLNAQGGRPYPHVKLEKSLSFHAADTNNNCDAAGGGGLVGLDKMGLAFVQQQQMFAGGLPLLHSPGGGGEKKMISPVVSPVTSSPDGTAAMDVMKMGGGGLTRKDSNDGRDGELTNDAQSKRSGHIYSEQKRRFHIKNGFDLLHSLIPQLQQSSSSASKMSKAAVLQKGAEYIKQLKVERGATKEKMDRLLKERDALNNQISLLHSALPANGAPVSRQRTGKTMDMYNKYVLERTYENWKFWIFGFLFEPLLLSFNSTVSVASMEDLQRTAMLWVDQNCSLVELRPAITNKLRYLSTTTDILSDEPSTIKDEVMKVINRAANSGATTTDMQTTTIGASVGQGGGGALAGAGRFSGGGGRPGFPSPSAGGSSSR